MNRPPMCYLDQTIETNNNDVCYAFIDEYGVFRKLSIPHYIDHPMISESILKNNTTKYILQTDPVPYAFNTYSDDGF